MKKILITGITGFAGSHLAELLLKDSQNQLIGTYHSAYDTNELPFLSSVRLEQVDITSAEQVTNLLKTVAPDELYHLAGAASPSESSKDPIPTFEANVFGTLNILEGLKSEKLRYTKVLLVTSAEIYGKVAPKDLPITEETSFHPMNQYAVSKITQDYLGQQYFLADNFPIICVRPFNHIGPRQSPKFVVSSFAKQLAEIEKTPNTKGEIHVGNLNTVRDFTDVEDIVKGYVLLMQKGEVGKAYNIGSGEGVKIADILDMLCSFISKEIDIIEDPTRLRSVEVPERVCDPSKIQELGWSPSIPLEESLKNTLEYWRKKV